MEPPCRWAGACCHPRDSQAVPAWPPSAPFWRPWSNRLHLCCKAVPLLYCPGVLQAAIMTGERHERVTDLLLLDVTPLSLGIATSERGSRPRSPC